MARKSEILCKTSLTKINRYFKTLDFPGSDEYKEKFLDIIKKDVKLIKDCSEKSIVDNYIEVSKLVLRPELETNDVYWDTLKQRVRNILILKYTSNKTFDNNIDIYFNEVKKEYIMHPVSELDEIEFLPENRDIFIKNNLKLVIECAKRYQNLGLPFEDLILIGNYGLLTAFEKFDKNRANLRIKIIKLIKNSELEEFTFKDAEEIIRQGFTYSKNLDQSINKIPKEGFVNKNEFIEWVKKNIKTAVFASVAFQWIRAYIILELNKLSKIVRVPKTAKKTGENPVSIIRLDSINPHTEDCYHDNQISEVANEEFLIEDESIENMEKQNLFKDLVNKLLDKLNALDRRIIKKRFGIGFPFQLSVNEIAENEGISVNKVKYSINSSLQIIASNIPGRDKEMIIDMLK